ncbi:hypothetical protein [Virgibacillus sp. DJP39]|uniref:hypothetical protein n=1 Tax=Virgibacillus sp. DJP39 TaxID=3409790 RepID=UPI003BB75122
MTPLGWIFWGIAVFLILLSVVLSRFGMKHNEKVKLRFVQKNKQDIIRIITILTAVNNTPIFHFKQGYPLSIQII